jgi:hypothetical protein
MKKDVDGVSLENPVVRILTQAVDRGSSRMADFSVKALELLRSVDTKLINYLVSYLAITCFIKFKLFISSVSSSDRLSFKTLR